MCENKDNFCVNIHVNNGESTVWECDEIEKMLIKKQQESIKHQKHWQVFQKNQPKYTKVYQRAYSTFYQQEYNKLCQETYNKYFQQEYNKLIQKEYAGLCEMYKFYQQEYEKMCKQMSLYGLNMQPCLTFANLFQIPKTSEHYPDDEFNQFHQLYCWNYDFCHGVKNNPEKEENWCLKCAKKATHGSSLWPGVCHHCCVLLMENRYTKCPGIKTSCIRHNTNNISPSETFKTLLLVRKRLCSDMMIQEPDNQGFEKKISHDHDMIQNHDNNLDCIISQIMG